MDAHSLEHALNAALDRGDPARVEIGAIKVFGARMLSNVIVWPVSVSTKI